jgi:tryptophan halogenase
MVSNVTVVGGGSAGFLAAIALKAKLPELAVTVLRSKEIGIIGVGEGSTLPLTQFLHQFIGLGNRPFLDIACPTWKLGMKFLWGPRQHFFYPFGSEMELRLPQLRKNKAFYCGPDMDFSSGHGALMAMDKIFERGEDGKPRMHYQLAYHVENEKFVRFLETFAQHLGVQIRDDTIEHVMQDERGVAGLKLASGATQTADLYVDCSGFRSLLLGQTLGEPFVSFKSSLLCERAVVGGWPRGAGEPIHPYTTCETMDAGWCWQIEHETRVNRGYVYCPDFISDDQAQAEFRAKNPKLGDTRVVKFVSGRYERAWVKNVVAIGNASGFVEPLEATALAVIANRAQLLAETLIFSDRQVPAVRIDMYNRHHAIVWESIRRFLAVHYKYNPRVDTPFWRACSHDVNLAGAEGIIDYYQTCGPDAAFEAMLVDRLDVFGMKGYITILVGQCVPTRYEYKPSDGEWAIWNQERQRLKQAAATAMNTEETLAALRRMGLSARSE